MDLTQMYVSNCVRMSIFAVLGWPADSKAFCLGERPSLWQWRWSAPPSKHISLKEQSASVFNVCMFCMYGGSHTNLIDLCNVAYRASLFIIGASLFRSCYMRTYPISRLK